MNLPQVIRMQQDFLQYIRNRGKTLITESWYRGRTIRYDPLWLILTYPTGSVPVKIFSHRLSGPGSQ